MDDVEMAEVDDDPQPTRGRPSHRNDRVPALGEPSPAVTVGAIFVGIVPVPPASGPRSQLNMKMTVFEGSSVRSAGANT